MRNGQVWSCTKCGFERIWGVAAFTESESVAKTAILVCSNCIGWQEHVYMRHRGSHRRATAGMHLHRFVETGEIREP